MSTKAPNPVDKYVGSRVRMRRIMLGMSQEKLGEALGLTFQQVQKYEKGTNRVGASRLQQISEILQVPVSFLFEGGPGAIQTPTASRSLIAGLCLGLPRHLRRPRTDPRLHAHHRCQASPQHRRPGRADRRRAKPRISAKHHGISDGNSSSRLMASTAFRLYHSRPMTADSDQNNHDATH